MSESKTHEPMNDPDPGAMPGEYVDRGANPPGDQDEDPASAAGGEVETPTEHTRPPSGS